MLHFRFVAPPSSEAVEHPLERIDRQWEASRRELGLFLCSSLGPFLRPDLHAVG